MVEWTCWTKFILWWGHISSFFGTRGPSEPDWPVSPFAWWASLTRPLVLNLCVGCPSGLKLMLCIPSEAGWNQSFPHTRSKKRTRPRVRGSVEGGRTTDLPCQQCVYNMTVHCEQYYRGLGYVEFYLMLIQCDSSHFGSKLFCEKYLNTTLLRWNSANLPVSV